MRNLFSRKTEKSSIDQERREKFMKITRKQFGKRRTFNNHDLGIKVCRFSWFEKRGGASQISVVLNGGYKGIYVNDRNMVHSAVILSEKYESETGESFKVHENYSWGIIDNTTDAS